MLKKMRFKAKITADLCLLMVLAATMPAQVLRTKPPDTATLRNRFVEAFGKDFDLVKDRFTTRARVCVTLGAGRTSCCTVVPE
jgi:hypothetical protein